MNKKFAKKNPGEAPAAAPAGPAAETAEPGKPCSYFRIFAFHGGGLDAVMQLGIAHALLLAEGRIAEDRPLDMIAGISAGAINAVALAEILQAGDAGDSTEQRLAAQVARLLEFLEGYRNAPATVLRGFLPDLYETTHRQALKSVVLPRHFGAERRTREESIATRAGGIRLLNGLLDVRVSIGTVVRFIRLKLGWNAAHELVWWRRLAVRFGLLGRGWWLTARNCAVLSQPLGRVAAMTVREAVLQLARGSAPKREEGVEAAEMMFDASAGRRKAGAALCWLAGFGLIAGLLSGVLIALVVLGAILLAILLPYLLLAAAPPVAFVALLGLVVWPEVKKIKPVFARHAEGWLADFPRRLRRCRQVVSLLLEHYSILSDLGDSYALKEALVRLFDPKYFGEFRLDTGLQRALRSERADPRAAPNRHRRRLDAYEKNCASRPLKVVPLAANLRTGRIEALPRRASVVDALMAACAVVPFYRAQPLRVPGTVPRRQWFIDGVNVSNDPVTEALGCLREDEATVQMIYDKHAGVRIYSVPLLPIERDELPGRVETYTRLVDVGLRALQLQRFQDGQLTKKLVETYRRALPGNHSVFYVPPPAEQPEKKTRAFFLTDLIHLTPPRPLDLNTRIPGAANAEERRALMESAVADGCRALLQRLLTEAEGGDLHLAARGLWERREITVSGADAYVPCRRLFVAGKGPLQPLPGNSAADNPGPGLPDICRRCAAIRGRKPEEDALPQHVRLPWKIAAEAAPPAAKKPQVKPAEFPDPAVAFLFSGGVFRGVFQVGFANAVSELGLMPDIVAGASVGTIIGALVGRVLRCEGRAARRFQMQRLAGTFLAIDQFVMTDRFADFVRHLSVRAAGADFSLRDADLFFRRYDTGASAPLADRARRVVAGLERVFYISPFELRDFTETLRNGDYRSSWSQVKGFVQDWLDRSGVGLELLGPEPLEMLINGIIFNDRPPAHAGFGSFATRRDDADQRPRFQLLGTTTNLTKGRLEILRAESGAQLIPGLLASSAFPAVFRPRWSWELFAQSNSADQFCDGGVMDNLPLDSVVEYLSEKDETTGCWRYLRRPEVPHLILTASLEPDPEDWTDGNLFPPEKIKDYAGSWPVLSSRAGELRYNEKISKFAGAQKYIRAIIEHRKDSGEMGFNPQDENLPLNLEVAVVKPQWLCSTFAFHTMLGFRRRDQAASIAHGCAATMKLLAGIFAGPFADPARRTWAQARGVQVQQLAGGGRRRELTASEQATGVCWHRCAEASGAQARCPFSAAVVRTRALREEKLGDQPLTEPEAEALTSARATLAHSLDAIYRACGEPATHERR